jgi:hypothetical protein
MKTSAEIQFIVIPYHLTDFTDRQHRMFQKLACFFHAGLCVKLLHGHLFFLFENKCHMFITQEELFFQHSSRKWCFIILEEIGTDFIGQSFLVSGILLIKCNLTEKMEEFCVDIPLIPFLWRGCIGTELLDMCRKCRIRETGKHFRQGLRSCVVVGKTVIEIRERVVRCAVIAETISIGRSVGSIRVKVCKMPFGSNLYLFLSIMANAAFQKYQFARMNLIVDFVFCDIDCSFHNVDQNMKRRDSIFVEKGFMGDQMITDAHSRHTYIVQNNFIHDNSPYKCDFMLCIFYITSIILYIS